MTTTSTADRIAGALRGGYANLNGRGGQVNEAVTRSVLIDRVLEELGYPPTHRSPENADRGDRPDDLCYLRPVGPTPGHPALVLEAKRLDAEFDRVPPGRARGYSPDRQIQRYLENNRISGPGTIGVLTDGIRWRLYQRTGNAAADVQFSKNFNFSRLADPSQAALSAVTGDDLSLLDEFIQQLSRQAVAARTVPVSRPAPVNLADGLFDALSGDAAPELVLREMLGEPDAVANSRLENADSLTGIRLDAHNNDWESYAVAQGPELSVSQPGLEGSRVAVAAVKFKPRASQEMNRGDVALAARIVASSAQTANAAVVFAYETGPDGAVSARMAAAAAGQVNMTAGFDPALHSPSARTAIDQQLRLIRDTSAPLNAERLLSPLAVATLRQQFYREVAQWTARIQEGKDQAGRQAVLRHLIRVMFSWILKEENLIPPEIFEPAFNDTQLADLDEYHRQVLLFLFHERLNVHPERRDEHPVPGINAALDHAPFLNGSLFARQDGDNELDLEANDYWSVDNDQPGLFTILNRYHWTMDEHRPGESEQTLDPELLSNLFERLIVPTEKAGESPLRQPQGTYYTPADVADEMVKDALSAAVKDHAGPLNDAQLLDLFGDSDTPLPNMRPAAKKRLAGRIRELRVFDPAVGSGEFLFSTLLGLQRALKKLEGTEEPAEEIIHRQLRGQDINPLAVQIARLRLFIAITAARRRNAPGQDEPLPNLEAVIVCADTLETVADPQWRQDQLDMAAPEVAAAVTEIAETRAQWFGAHTEDHKTELLQQYSARRDRLESLLQQRGELASPELREFVKADLIGHTPARTDARLLFHESPWRGFDIVIGNPPYEALSKSMDKDAIKRLTDAKRYRTTGGGDLYNLFCETALSLASPNGGVVTLIVPLSIAFGRNKQTLRNIFNQRSKSVTLRHYSNRPDTTFNASPTVKTPENRQRATIVTAILGNSSEPEIKSTGLQRWFADERQQCIQQRRTVIVPRFNSAVDQSIAGQWPRIPTPEVVQLVEAIAKQKKTVSEHGTIEGETLACPRTAYHFISTIPEGSVSPRSEYSFTVASDNNLRLIMAALNGHVAYAWWQVYGDDFHLKLSELTTITIPDKWTENPQPAIEMGQKLIDAMPECIVENKQQGGVWRNVDFHTYAPDLIAELDRLHITALGLPEEPLLTHLRIMRSSSSWNYP